MKILFSCLSESWGGMEMYTVSLASLLIKNNIAVTLLCFPHSKLYEEARKRNIKVIAIASNKYFQPIKIISLSKKLKNIKFDLIHSHASKDLWLVVPALKASKLKTPLFFTKHVGSFIKKRDVFHNALYNRVDIAFAISSIIKKNLIETTSLEKSKIKILHNGVDTKFFNPEVTNGEEIRDEFGVDKNSILIGMIARFTWGKGHQEFLKAAKILIKQFDNLKFMIVGEASKGETKYTSKIKSLAKELHIENHVIFTGFRKDTREILAALDIFAFPSHSEAFGIALVEAMSMAKPSVCSNSDGILDIAIDGKTSLLFEKLNELDLAIKLKLLIDSKELRLKMGNEARKRAVEQFDFQKILEKTINYYNELTRNNF